MAIINRKNAAYISREWYTNQFMQKTKVDVTLIIDFENKTFTIQPPLFNGKEHGFVFVNIGHCVEMDKAVLKAIDYAIDYAVKELDSINKP